ncbi:MAG: hypothetical protein GF400_02170 [Candidatus Eisenbacteria bacterium]|nr:hypothetical protein [Candidatus Eisenbacteria bacterium]
MRAVVCMSAIAVMFFATAASAFGPGMQSPAQGQDFWKGGEFTPVVGYWAEYQMTFEDKEPMTMRVAIVGQEEDAYWYETVMKNEEGEPIVTKMLVSGDPGDTGNVKRMIIKSGEEQAIEMPVEMMKMQGMEKAEAKEEMESGTAPESFGQDLGVEEVTVPAGTFKAHHWRGESEESSYDVWVQQEIGPYGLIKTTSEDYEMVLVAHGDDAETMITETPKSFPMPGFKMPGMGGE